MRGRTEGKFSVELVKKSDAMKILLRIRAEFGTDLFSAQQFQDAFEVLAGDKLVGTMGKENEKLPVFAWLVKEGFIKREEGTTTRQDDESIPEENKFIVTEKGFAVDINK